MLIQERPSARDGGVHSSAWGFHVWSHNWCGEGEQGALPGGLLHHGGGRWWKDEWGAQVYGQSGRWDKVKIDKLIKTIIPKYNSHKLKNPQRKLSFHWMPPLCCLWRSVRLSGGASQLILSLLNLLFVPRPSVLISLWCLTRSSFMNVQCSSIFPQVSPGFSTFTQIDRATIKIVLWFDNEYGFAHRVVDLVKKAYNQDCGDQWWVKMCQSMQCLPAPPSQDFSNLFHEIKCQ